MKTLLFLSLLVVSAYSLCTTHSNCADCVVATSDTDTACVFCMDQHSCHDPNTAAFSEGCRQIQYSTAQCSAGTFVTPGQGQRVVTYNADVNTYEESFYTTSITDSSASVVELTLVKGHWLALSDYNNFPAVVVRALSSSSVIGSEYFSFAFVPQAVQEWNDSNADGQVQLTELVSPPYKFNDGYSWSLANNQNIEPLYELSIVGMQTGFPTLTIACKISDRDNVTYDGFNMTGNNAKCDISVTGLTLQNKLNNWVLRFYFVGKTANIYLTGQPFQAVPNLGAGRAGHGINMGAGGFISWVNTAGSGSLTGSDINVVFGGTIAAGLWGGKSFVDAVEANFGFPNPSPGSDYDLYWDPIMSVPNISGVSQIMPSIMVAVLVALKLIA